MDFSWTPHLVAEINKVPAGLQIALVGLLYLIVIRVTAWYKEKKADSNGAISPSASSTRGAVEELRQELLPVLSRLTDSIVSLEKTVSNLGHTVDAIKDIAKQNGSDVAGLKAALRDAQEEMRRVADIELALANKIDLNTERMVEIKANLQNVIQNEIRKAM